VALRISRMSLQFTVILGGHGPFAPPPINPPMRRAVRSAVRFAFISAACFNSQSVSQHTRNYDRDIYYFSYAAQDWFRFRYLDSAVKAGKCDNVRMKLVFDNC
jgi:hypothetical protein